MGSYGNGLREAMGTVYGKLRAWFTGSYGNGLRERFTGMVYRNGLRERFTGSYGNGFRERFTVKVYGNGVRERFMGSYGKVERIKPRYVYAWWPGQRRVTQLVNEKRHHGN